MLEEVDDDREVGRGFFEHGDAVDEFHDEVETGAFEDRALLDHFLDAADSGVFDLVGDLVFDLGLIEETLGFGACFFDMLERPDLL